MRRPLLIVLVLLGTTVPTIVVVSAGIGIFPGSMKWTASTLCPDDQPDPFVVRTEHTDSEGTSYNFSLHCMGERGDYREVGVAKPMGLLFAGTYATLLALLVVVLLWVRRRKGLTLPLGEA